MALPLPRTLSPSKVSAFKSCPLAFRFSVIDRVPEPPSAAAAKGTVVHRALQLLFDEPPAGRTPAAALAKLAVARAEVLGDGEYAALELLPDEAAAFDADTERLVLRYFDIEDPAAVTPIGLELMMEARTGGVRLRGIIDRLELDAEGELVVTDYKTGRVPNQRYEQHSLGGVHFYAFLCQVVLGRLPSRIQLLYLSEGVAIVATPSERSVRGLVQRVGAVWSAVERACVRDDFRPSPGALCAYCSFQSFCPAFGGDPELARSAGAGGGQLAVAAAVAAS
jgi:putative RecB family exonuclease